MWIILLKNWLVTSLIRPLERGFIGVVTPAQLVIALARHAIIDVATIIGRNQPLIGDILIPGTHLGSHIAGGG